MKECTLGIVKPDAHDFAEEIMGAIERAGLKVAHHKTVQLTEPRARKFYWEHKKRHFFEGLTKFMASGPITVIVIEGDNAIARWRELLGATNPNNAAPGTIRAVYGNREDPTQNAGHGSDGSYAAMREIDFFFSELSK